ncbi:MAG: DUF2281 domain-containing protein [Bacteroidia bacterium]|nr:DUF2281 domain-containing protein [Bacteroidia bacterium]
MAYQITNLPTEIRQQVEDYIEFLLSKYPKKGVDQKKIENPRLHAYGLYKGRIRISSDFDAPLDDFKDYM